MGDWIAVWIMFAGFSTGSQQAVRRWSGWTIKQGLCSALSHVVQFKTLNLSKESGFSWILRNTELDGRANTSCLHPLLTFQSLTKTKIIQKPQQQLQLNHGENFGWQMENDAIFPIIQVCVFQDIISCFLSELHRGKVMLYYKLLELHYGDRRQYIQISRYMLCIIIIIIIRPYRPVIGGLPNTCNQITDTFS